MGLVNAIRKLLPKKVTRYKLVTERGGGFYGWNGKVYHSDIVRACIRPKVKAVGKLVAKHIRYGQDGSIKINPDASVRFLLEEPNPYMSGQKFLEKMATQLELNNNAFALIIRDDNGIPIELFPISAVGYDAIYEENGDLVIRFSMMNGRQMAFAYEDLIHLRQDFCDDDIFGSPIGDVLAPLMEVVSVTDQGIIKAIKNSSVVQWLLKYHQSLREEDLAKNAQDFAKNYLSITGDGIGVAATDAKADAIRVEPKEYVPNASQMSRTTARIYALFGTNEKIVTSSYTEDEWLSYFEAQIEPVARDLKHEYTRKLFSRRERAHGNEIVFEAGDLKFASLKTILSFVAMVDRGAMTPNEWRGYLNLAPVPGGDKPIRRLDTQQIEANITPTYICEDA